MNSGEYTNAGDTAAKLAAADAAAADEGAEWLAMFEKLKRFHETHGHANVPQKNGTEQLSAWVLTQKQEYKMHQEGKPSHMSKGRINLLNEIQFDSWYDRYAAFKQKYKSPHCNLPADLHVWASLQRHDLKIFEENEKNNLNKKSNLTKERAQMLKDIGLGSIKWQTKNPTSWMINFLELKKYRDEYRHCNVPQSYKQNNISLGKWVDNQKTQYKYRKDGKPSHLTEQRVQLLNKLGFEFR